MPLTQANISGDPVVLSLSGGTTGIVTGATIMEEPDQIVTTPVQVLGLNPLNLCRAEECRTFNGDCYVNNVFGTVNVNNSTYENDVTPYFISDGLQRDFTFILEKRNGNSWEFSANAGYVNIGNIRDYGYFTAQPNYTGIEINWGKVLTLFGSGMYRIKFETVPCFTYSISRTRYTIVHIGAGVIDLKLKLFADGVLIAPEFLCVGTNVVANMQNLATWINDYQNANFAIPEFLATYDIINGWVLLNGLQGQNAVFSDTGTDTGDHDYTIVNHGNFIGGTATPTTPCIPFCFVGEPHRLMPFNCDIANLTIKFETNQTGIIGSIQSDGSIFDLCGITLYDSIRVPGFFGHGKGSYNEELLEYQNGLIDMVRDENILKYFCEINLVPMWLHKRLMSYGLMADYLFVSDYNRNNSDYEIKHLRVIKDGGYEPEYIIGNRLSSVELNFKAGQQSIIKSSSCN